MIKKLNLQQLDERNFEQLQEYVKGYATQIENIKKKFRHATKLQTARATLRYLFSYDTNYRKYYNNIGKNPVNFLFNEFSTFFRRIRREYFLKQHSKTNVQDYQPFVFFPLHFEPERALLMTAPFYNNQLEVIINIAKTLPVNYVLLVKDHPVMKNIGWREIKFYKQILELPNVILIHPSINSEELIKKSSLVISIAGTGSMHAAFYCKPAIVFADTIFSNLPSVFRIFNLEDLPEIIKKALKTKVNLTDLNRFVNHIEKNSFEFDFAILDIITHDYFYVGGYYTGVEITENRMKSFIEDYQKIFKKLADEHLKAIYSHKETVSKLNKGN